jgi:hypothetical protein
VGALIDPLPFFFYRARRRSLRRLGTRSLAIVYSNYYFLNYKIALEN